MTNGMLNVPTQVSVTLRGTVPQSAAAYSREKVARVMEHTSEPILTASVVLTHYPDPGHVHPATAEAALDVNGTTIRASAASDDHFAAVDLMQDKLQRNLTEHLDRLRSLRRRQPRAAAT